ncbi:hypothetical protein [Acinetobacter larvae]|uniref:Uncharacterized protein n=1 Tax=Acinetobacter larvae TaxID=1789224 RepID=A0A1B2M240_9GAMM|nr:hypothetical protein [Acinetobacter larvae]AOA59257.1 hypothetical protein BFG52_13395 [Acinetobacter larvae]
MAFDLVQYFAGQIRIQKPELFKKTADLSDPEHMDHLNALLFGKLIQLWQHNPAQLYAEIHAQDLLFIQDIVRHLTTSAHNQSPLAAADFEAICSEILLLHFAELTQMDQTAHYGQDGMQELLLGQIEHLAGQAPDWVWQCNELTELVGSQAVPEDTISLDETMKEFNQMVQQHHDDHSPAIQDSAPLQPTWAKVLEPIVALVVLWVLADALCKYVF